MHKEMRSVILDDFLKKKLSSYGASMGMFLFYSLIAILLGKRHDYSAYSDQWSLIFSGADPWVNHGVWTGNAYGIFFNFFAFFHALHPLFPKVLFILSWMLSGFWVLSQFQWSSREKKELFLLFFLNPLFLIEFLSYGLNDSVVASLVLFAVVLSERSKGIYAGILLGLGVLFKFVPLVLFPLFWVLPGQSIRSWNHKFFASFFSVVLMGLILSYGLWGDSFLFPFTFASHRPPKDLSIFRFLISEMSLWAGVFSETRIAVLSKTLIFLSSLMVFLSYFRKKISFIQAVAAEFLVTLMFYQVGHLQFQTSLLFLLPLLVMDFKNRGVWNLSKKRVMIVYVSFLMLFQVFVTIMGQYHPLVEWVRSWISIPYFLLAMGLLRVILSHQIWSVNPERE